MKNSKENIFLRQRETEWEGGVLSILFVVRFHDYFKNKKKHTSHTGKKVQYKTINCFFKKKPQFAIQLHKLDFIF